jgi:aminoglycoside phosphotransferase (APT) family kinase protein
MLDPAPNVHMTETELAEGLVPFLMEKTGARAVRVENVRRMTGGTVRETWALDVALAEKEGRPRTLALAWIGFRAGGMRQFGPHEEFRLLRAAHDAFVPVPRPYFEGETATGQLFYLMERVQGETLGGRIVRDDRYKYARAALPAQLAAALAAIHRIPIGPDLAFLPAPPPDRRPIEWEVERLEDLYRMITPDPHPAFELAMRWLATRKPESDGPRAIVHGDFRIGNVIVGEEGLRGVLDWELAHVGDPMEDLGWLCVRSWRFGADHLSVGGVGTRHDLFQAYEEASGAAVDPERVRFWEIYGNLRWGIFTIAQARMATEGGKSNVELASIGRRTAETEWEILNLLEAA